MRITVVTPHSLTSFSVSMEAKYLDHQSSILSSTSSSSGSAPLFFFFLPFPFLSSSGCKRMEQAHPSKILYFEKNYVFFSDFFFSDSLVYQQNFPKYQMQLKNIINNRMLWSYHINLDNCVRALKKEDKKNEMQMV